MSTLRYGVIFWGNCTERETVFKAQKRCVRSICRLKPDEPHFKSLKILTFPSLYIYEVAVFVKTNPNPFVKVSQTRHRSIRSQYMNYVSFPSSKTALMRKNILCMGSKFFYKIPNYLHSLNYNLFKKKLYELLVGKCYYTVNDIRYKDIRRYLDVCIFHSTKP